MKSVYSAVRTGSLNIAVCASTSGLIDVPIPGNRNVIRKEDEKILKYEDLVTEMQRLWNVKAKAIPVITN